MNNLNEYSFSSIMGMLIIGLVCTLIGFASSLLTIFRGEIVVVGRSGKVIIREKIKNLRPLRIKYFYALVFTLIFGPITFFIGITSLLTLLSTQIR